MHIKKIENKLFSDTLPKFTVPLEYADYTDIFFEDSAITLPDYGPHDYTIELIEKSKSPLYGLIYNFSETKLATLQAYIDQHLITDFIWYSKSSAAVFILFSKKSDGSLRLYVDYWELNNTTIKNKYLLSLVGKSLDQLGKAQKFTNIDLTPAYHCLCIMKKNKWKIAFQTQYKNFKYQVLSFGLSNASATFQAYINSVLAENLTVFVIVYLNDIVIYSKNFKDYITYMKWVFQRLQEYFLFANLKKYSFHNNKVKFLRYIISAKRVQIKDSKIKSIKNWPEPASL